jgi:hypothetical protein
LGASNGKSKPGSATVKRRYPSFAVCVDNHGHEGSLLVGKIYRVVRPAPNDLPYDLRVIDEECEDYLYAAKRFVPIVVPGKVRRVLAAAGE